MLLAGAIYYSIVRPIAVGGMLVGASYTLFKMRKQLSVGMGRGYFGFEEVGSGPCGDESYRARPQSKVVFAGIGLVFVAMIMLYHYFISGAGNLSSSRVLAGALVAPGS